MKYILKHNDFDNYHYIIEQINNANSIEELNELENQINFDKLDEGITDSIKNFIEDKKNKLFNLIDKGKHFVYDILGLEDNSPKNTRTKRFVNDIISTGAGIASMFPNNGEPNPDLPIEEEHILMICKYLKGKETIEYKIFDGDNATNHIYNYKKVFSSFNKNLTFTPNIKSTKEVKIKRFISEEDGAKEYAVIIYALLDELEVSKDLYGYGPIEKVTPSITIYMKNLSEEYDKHLKAYYNQINKLVKKENITFSNDLINEVISTIKVDMKLNKD